MLNKHEKIMLFVNSLITIAICLVTCIPYGITSIPKAEIVLKYLVYPIILVILYLVNLQNKNRNYRPAVKFTSFGTYLPIFLFSASLAFNTVLVLIRAYNIYSVSLWLILLTVAIIVMAISLLVMFTFSKTILYFTKNEMLLIDALFIVLLIVEVVCFRSIAVKYSLFESGLHAGSFLHILVPCLITCATTALLVLHSIALFKGNDEYKRVTCEQLLNSKFAVEEEDYEQARKELLTSMYSFARGKLGVVESLEVVIERLEQENRSILDKYSELEHQVAQRYLKSTTVTISDDTEIVELRSTLAKLQDKLASLHLEYLEEQRKLTEELKSSFKRIEIESAPLKEEVKEVVVTKVVSTLSDEERIKLEEEKLRLEREKEEHALEAVRLLKENEEKELVALRLKQEREQKELEALRLKEEKQAIISESEEEMNRLEKEKELLEEENNRLEAERTKKLEEERLALLEQERIKKEREAARLIEKKIKPTYLKIVTFVETLRDDNPEMNIRIVANDAETMHKVYKNKTLFLVLQKTRSDYRITFGTNKADGADLLYNYPGLVVKPVTPKGEQWLKITNKNEQPERLLKNIIKGSLQYVLNQEEAEKKAKEEEIAKKIAEKEAAKLKIQKEKEAAKLKAKKEREKEAAKLKAQKEREKEAAKLKAQKEREKEAAKLKAQKEREKEAAKLKAQKEKEASKSSPKEDKKAA